MSETLKSRGPLFNVPYKGTLSVLRSLPFPDTADALQDDVSLPENHLLIVDHRTLTETFASLLSAITHPATGTHIIIPELAVDCLDVDDKDGRRQLDAFQSSDAEVQSHITVKVNHNTKQLLLNAKEKGISFQRANQYDHTLISRHNIQKKSYDLRLMVACAKYFQDVEQRSETSTKKRAVVLVSSDTAVRAFGEQCGVCVKSMKDLLRAK